MKISARNQLKGIVEFLHEGPVNCEVGIKLPDGAVITSIVTKTAVESLGLKAGAEVYAIIKASNVMVAVD